MTETERITKEVMKRYDLEDCLMQSPEYSKLKWLDQELADWIVVLSVVAAIGIGLIVLRWMVILVWFALGGR